MIGLPGYLGPTGGPYDTAQGLAGQRLDQNYDPVLAGKQKLEAEKAMRSYELTNIAQQLENLRLRLKAMDLYDHAETLDTVICLLVLRWNEERTR